MTTDTDTLLSSTLCRPGHAPALTPAKRFISASACRPHGRQVSSPTLLDYPACGLPPSHPASLFRRIARSADFFDANVSAVKRSIHPARVVQGLAQTTLPSMASGKTEQLQITESVSMRAESAL